MLTALEQGVKGDKWHTLIDKVCGLRTLEAATTQVVSRHGAAGVDHVTVNDFAARQADGLSKLSRQLRDGTYRPQAVRRVHIPKPGCRHAAAGHSHGSRSGWCRRPWSR